MKLAEALQERAALIKRIKGLESRLEDNALVIADDEPPEAPETLLAELNSCTDRLEELATRINLTNAGLRIGLETMTALLSRRDAMRIRLRVLQSTAEATRSSRNHFRSEVRYTRTIDVPALQKRIDQLSRQLRELDNTIQQANWSNDLI